MTEQLVLNVGDIDLNDLRAYYENLIAADEEKARALQAKAERNRNFLTKLNGSLEQRGETPVVATSAMQADLADNANGYDKGWSWLKKFRFLLVKTGKASSMGAALEEMRKYEDIGSGMDERYRHTQKRLAGNLKVQTDNGRLKRVKSEAGTYLYGLPEWFNENGELKEEHK